MARPTRKELEDRLAVAETALRLERAAGSRELPRDDLLHELHTHQVELEAQNQALREAQGQLEESRRRYVDLYDFAPIPYLTLDRYGAILELNLTAAAVLGSDRVVLVGKPFRVVARLADPHALFRHLREVLETDRPVIGELAFTVRGRLYEVQVVSTSIPSLGGRRRACRTALVDVSARRAAEREAKAAHESTAAIHARLERLDRASASVGTALAGLAGPEDLSGFLDAVAEEARLLTDAGLAAIRLGPVAEERPFGELVRPESPLSVPVRYREEVRGYLHLADPRGVAAFRAEDELVARVLADRIGAALEVARLMQLEAGARREAESAVQARDRLLAVLSHDLRNYLTSIRLAFGALARAYPAEQHPAAHRYTELGLLAATRMNELVKAVLDASLMDMGRFVVRPRLEDAAGILEEALRAIEPQADAAGLHLSMRAPSPEARVLADRDRVVEALVNLLRNAVQSTPAGGDVRISAVPAGAAVRFAVGDTGRGIDADHLATLFDRRWTTDGTPGGTGLGLSIVKGIVEAHGGTIEARSEVGVGTTIAFTVPSAPGEQDVRSGPVPEADKRSPVSGSGD